MSEVIRCPEKACSGWVCVVEESPTRSFFGCGECGVVWDTKEQLNDAIAVSVAKFPYRAQCYVRTGSQFDAASLTSEPANYVELVQNEWTD